MHLPATQAELYKKPSNLLGPISDCFQVFVPLKFRKWTNFQTSSICCPPPGVFQTFFCPSAPAGLDLWSLEGTSFYKRKNHTLGDSVWDFLRGYGGWHVWKTKTTKKTEVWCRDVGVELHFAMVFVVVVVVVGIFWDGISGCFVWNGEKKDGGARHYPLLRGSKRKKSTRLQRLVLVVNAAK